LKVLTALYNAGALQKVERAGLLSSLEKAGALSQIEKLLPLIESYKPITLAKSVLSIPSGTFYAGAAAVSAGEVGALLALPNDGPFLALKAVTGLAAIPLAVGLVIGGQVIGVIQGNRPAPMMQAPVKPSAGMVVNAGYHMRPAPQAQPPQQQMPVVLQKVPAPPAMLQQQKVLFLSAFVPGTGAFYDTNALLYQDGDTVRARVDALLQLEPLYHAMASAPDMGGLLLAYAPVAHKAPLISTQNWDARMRRSGWRMWHALGHDGQQLVIG
jgi:hypothetical protein